jgi:hypothetical protein
MKAVVVAHWYLPPPTGHRRKTPYLSAWKMTEAEAAQRGALLSMGCQSPEQRQVPETEEEVRHAQVAYQSAGRGGVA